MTVEKDLLAEMEKWLAKAKEKRSKITLSDKSKLDMLKNIDAYIADSGHFLKKGDLVRAFEAVIWAWSWLEILEELKVIE